MLVAKRLQWLLASASSFFAQLTVDSEPHHRTVWVGKDL